MTYRVSPRKAIVFKILYLLFSVAVLAYSAYIFLENLLNGFSANLTFDDIILLIATLFAILFEGSIIGFIIRSFKLPTILMKNLVFKNDGTPYKPGIALLSVGTVVMLALTAVFFVSSYVVTLFDMPQRAQYFILDVGLTLFVNFAFSLVYFFVFRHESGSFAII